ncbi:MAG: chorismate synthase [Candidatus Sericytochromatia bacterium]|nr:chorismate synthase [Candidatus Sericytochromatia bacterium]
MRFLTAGESHGPALVAIVEGLPADIPVLAETINLGLARRQQGHGRGGRMKIETDRVDFLSGIRLGKTIGSPVAMHLINKDYANWRLAMSPEPQAGDEAEAAIDKRKFTKPRPGHADLAGAQKYGVVDMRNILERASARETAARVAVGALAKAYLSCFGVQIFSHVVRLGGIAATALPASLTELQQAAEDSVVRCADPEATAAMVDLIDRTGKAGDTLGGVFEVVVTGLPPGLGSYGQWDKRLDAQLAAAVMSIQAVKGVEIGIGFEAADRPGSKVHDPIVLREGELARSSNNAGGLEGGVTNGEPLLVRGAMKPISTLRQPLPSVDLESRTATPSHFERSDVCAVPAAGVVGEAMVAWVLANAWAEKFGGDSIAEILANVTQYKASLPH